MLKERGEGEDRKMSGNVRESDVRWTETILKSFPRTRLLNVY